MTLAMMNETTKVKASVTTEATTWSHEQLGAAAEEEALVDDQLVHRAVGEEAEQQGADEAADEVDADDVEGVVVAELELQLDGEDAEDAGDEADEDRRHARRRSRRTG